MAQLQGYDRRSLAHNPPALADDRTLLADTRSLQANDPWSKRNDQSMQPRNRGQLGNKRALPADKSSMLCRNRGLLGDDRGSSVSNGVATAACEGGQSPVHTNWNAPSLQNHVMEAFSKKTTVMAGCTNSTGDNIPSGPSSPPKWFNVPGGSSIKPMPMPP